MPTHVCGGRTGWRTSFKLIYQWSIPPRMHPRFPQSENSSDGRVQVCGTKGQGFESLFSPMGNGMYFSTIWNNSIHPCGCSYGLGVMTVSFQLKDRSSILLKSGYLLLKKSSHFVVIPSIHHPRMWVESIHFKELRKSGRIILFICIKCYNFWYNGNIRTKSCALSSLAYCSFH